MILDKIDLKDKLEITIKNEQPVEEDEISLREIIVALLKGKQIIIKAVVVTILAALVFTSVTNPDRNVKNVAQVILSLNFDGIEKGLDPQGQRFDMGKIKSPAVLSKAVDSCHLQEQVKVDDLRQSIEITPIVPGDIVAKLQAMIEATGTNAKDNPAVSKLQDYVYYPNRFVISFKAAKEMDLNNEQSQQLLQAIVDSYTEYFYEKYSDRSLLSDAIARIDYTDYDYPEVPIIMRSQIDTMRTYLTAKSRQAPEFRSSVTGLSFNDVNEGIAIIDNIDINNLNSVISAYRITKDKNRLISSFEYRIKSYELKMAKSADESRLSTETVNRYQKEKSLIMMGNGDITQGMMEMDKPSEVYDDLVKRSLDSGVAASNTLRDIEYLRNEIAIYQTDVDIAPEVKQQKEKLVVSMIDKTDKKLRSWVDLTTKTLNDYLENVYFQNAIMQATPVQVNSPLMEKLPLNLAIGLVLGLMIGVFAALFKNYWQNSELYAVSPGDQDQSEANSVTESI